jgi:hypothetical protein
VLIAVLLSGAAIFALSGAEGEETPFSRLSKLASYLSENEAAQALECFDPAMKDYAAVEGYVRALGAQTDVLCAIDVISEEGTGEMRKLDTDWFVELRSQAEGGPVERRRERVKLEMRQFGSKWKIAAMAPVDILAPIRIQ